MTLTSAVEIRVEIYASLKFSGTIALVHSSKNILIFLCKLSAESFDNEKYVLCPDISNSNIQIFKTQKTVSNNR